MGFLLVIMELIFAVSYCFVTVNAFDGQTDGRTDGRIDDGQDRVAYNAAMYSVFEMIMMIVIVTTTMMMSWYWPRHLGRYLELFH